jgi:hypothetical protein
MATDKISRRSPVRASAKTRRITILPMPIRVTRRGGETWAAVDGSTFTIDPSGAHLVEGPEGDTLPSLVAFAAGEWISVNDT